MDLLRVAWFELREEFLAHHISAYPGSRPWPWWEFEGHEHERREIDPQRRKYCLARHVRGLTDPEEIAAKQAMLDRIAPRLEFYRESQLTYLERRGLLPAAEKQRIEYLERTGRLVEPYMRGHR